MRTIPIRNAEIEVDLINVKSTLAPIIFLHEGLGSVAMWRSKLGYWPELVCQATGRSGVVYSRRGYGQSSWIDDVRGANRLQPDYMQREAWEVLPELLSTLQIENPVLLGHSDGATIALLFASRFATSACIAMAPHVIVEDISIRSIEAAKIAYETGDLKTRLTKFHQDVDCAFWQWNDIWLSPGFRAFNIQEECLQITAPVLALQGEDDAYGSLRHILDLKTAGQIKQVVLKDRKSTRLNSSHSQQSRMPSSA